MSVGKRLLGILVVTGVTLLGTAHSDFVNSTQTLEFDMTHAAGAGRHAVSARARQSREQLLQSCAGTDPRSSETACRQMASEATRNGDRGDAWIEGLGSEILVTRLARAAEEIRNHDAAVTLWRLATQRYPENSEYHYRLGRILLDEIGAYEEAYGPLLRATSQKAGFVDALLPLGYVQRRMQRPREAIATYQALLQVSPGAVEGRLGLAEALQDTRNYTAALEQLRDGVGPGVSFALAIRRRVLVANAQLWLGRGREAQETLRARGSERSSPHAHQLECSSATLDSLLGNHTDSRQSCTAVEGPPLCGCTALAAAAPSDTMPAFTDRDAAVAVAALTSSARPGGTGTTFVVGEVATFAPASAPRPIREALAAYVKAGARGYSLAVRNALGRLLDSVPAHKRVRFPASVTSTRILTAAAMKAAFGGEAPPFYEQFPQSRGIVILSAPVYSEDETAAVVFVHRVDRIDDPPGIIVVLQRSGAAWQAVGSLNTTSESSSTR